MKIEIHVSAHQRQSDFAHVMFVAELLFRTEDAPLLGGKLLAPCDYRHICDLFQIKPNWTR